MTLYQFKQQLIEVMRLENFELYSPLEVSGQIKAKNGGQVVQNFWNHSEKEGRYASILIDRDKFMQESGQFLEENNQF